MLRMAGSWFSVALLLWPLVSLSKGEEMQGVNGTEPNVSVHDIYDIYSDVLEVISWNIKLHTDDDKKQNETLQQADQHCIGVRNESSGANHTVDRYRCSDVDIVQRWNFSLNYAEKGKFGPVQSQATGLCWVTNARGPRENDTISLVKCAARHFEQYFQFDDLCIVKKLGRKENNYTRRWATCQTSGTILVRIRHIYDSSGIQMCVTSEPKHSLLKWTICDWHAGNPNQAFALSRVS